MALLPKEEGKGRLKETKITLKRTFVRKQLSLAVSSGEKKEKDDPARACALPCRIGCREPETNQTGQLEEDD
jgi:hypothetical protein